jgi:hypothetical protein
MLVEDGSHRVETASWDGDVEQEDVGTVSIDDLHSVVTRAPFGNDFELTSLRKAPSNTCAEQRMIVNDRNPYAAH